MKSLSISTIFVLIGVVLPFSALAGASRLHVMVFCDELISEESIAQEKITENPYDWNPEWLALYDNLHGGLVDQVPSPPHIQSIGIEKNDAGNYGYYFGTGRIDQEQAESIERVCGTFPTKDINSDLEKWSQDITSGFANVNPSDFIVVPHTTETWDALNDEDGAYVARHGDWIVTHKSYCSTFCYLKSTVSLIGDAIGSFLRQFGN